MLARRRSERLAAALTAALLAVPLASGTGCAVPDMPPPRAPTPPDETAVEGIEAVTMILSRPSTPTSDGAPGDDGTETSAGGAETSEEAPRSMLVTFAQAVDPLSVRPEQFVVVTATGSAVRPMSARLVPPGGPGETLAVTLRGRFGAGTPQVVRVLGPIFATDGAAVERESRPVETDEAWARPLLYMMLEPSDAARLCGGAEAGTAGAGAAGTGALRVWWSRMLAETPSDRASSNGGLRTPVVTEGSTSVHCVDRRYLGMLDPFGSTSVELPGAAVRDSAGRVSLGGEARPLPRALNGASDDPPPGAEETEETADDGAPGAGVP